MRSPCVRRPAAHDCLVVGAAPAIAQPEYAIGRTLEGRYRVERLIGRGSMGAVVAARHLALDQKVAIKFIRSDLRRDPQVVSRFAREAKALTLIASPGVTRVLDIGVSPQHGPYIVLELLDGRDLGSVLRDEGPLPFWRAVDYVLQACDALAAAHRVGITHRDIKPENLFLSRSAEVDEIKVLDFGIAEGTLEGRVFGEELSKRAPPEALLGTPLYMSPEHVRNQPDVDQRADVWSLGAVLYELLTGRTLFSGETTLQVCARILEDEPVALALNADEAPPELALVLARCLEKDRAARFDGVDALALALERLVAERRPFDGRRSQSRTRRRGDGVQGGGSPSASATAPSRSAPPTPLLADRAPSTAHPVRPIERGSLWSRSRRAWRWVAGTLWAASPRRPRARLD